jgi:ABC-type multidrug transport system ATPase subunit
MPPILEISALHKRYGRVHALQGIDLTLTEPGIHGFLGPNGAGKTTLIKLVAGLLRPTSGSVRIQGFDVQRDHVAALSGLGVMMETPHFYNHLSARDNLRLLACLTDGPAKGRISMLLERVGLMSKMRTRVAGYSRGMRQRLGLAAAVLHDPKLLVLDEPTNGLDPAGIADVRQWLLDMTRNEGRTILLSSHQMGEVERVCDSLTIINEGTIVASGKASELIKGKNAIIVRTTDAEAALRILADLPNADRVDLVNGDRLRIESSVLSPADINRALMSRNIDVVEISQERETLEDTFLRLVGRPIHGS